MTATEHVILVDEHDNELGIAEKIQAHRDSLCHRAFSAFILRKKPEISVLLQQRAESKYHSPGLWTNTCCSHPRPGENILEAGRRRLQEEMGIDIPLRSLGWFHYIAQFSNGLTENEVDHVLIGMADDVVPMPNQDEVKDYRWVTIPDLKREIALDPDRFTPWLALALEIVIEELNMLKGSSTL